MNDLISRQDAIDALTHLIDLGDKELEKQRTADEMMARFMALPWRLKKDALNLAIYEMEHLPSAQPERKTGRWIPQDHNKKYGNVTTCMYYYPVCSECGHTGDFGMNFCPNCGSDNSGGRA